MINKESFERMLVLLVVMLLLVGCSKTQARPTTSEADESWIKLFDYDPEAPLDIEEIGVEDREGASVSDITFAGPNGERISAYLVSPKGAGDGPYPAVLYVHWLGQIDANRNQFLDEAVSLASEGVVSLLVDDIYCFPGERRPWRSSTAAEDREEVIQQIVELRRALDLLITEANADPERIAFVGHDFGGMFGAVLAGVDPRIKAMVIMAAIPDFSDWFLINASLGPDEQSAYSAELQKVAPGQCIGKASSTSFFFQFANVDEFVSKEQATALFEAANEPKRIEWYNTGHALHTFNSATADRLEWLRKELDL